MESGLIICEFHFMIIKGTLQNICYKNGGAGIGSDELENHWCSGQDPDFKKGDLHSHFDPGSASQ